MRVMSDNWLTGCDRTRDHHIWLERVLESDKASGYRALSISNCPGKILFGQKALEQVSGFRMQWGEKFEAPSAGENSDSIFSGRCEDPLRNLTWEELQEKIFESRLQGSNPEFPAKGILILDGQLWSLGEIVRWLVEVRDKANVEVDSAGRTALGHGAPPTEVFEIFGTITNNFIKCGCKI